MRPQVKKDSQTRLAKILGQVSGLARMVEDDRDCPDILTQVAALRAALESLGAIIVSEHIEYCVFEGFSNAPGTTKLTSDERIEEVRVVLGRLLK